MIRLTQHKPALRPIRQNTPLAFRAIWALLRNWISPETARRFALLGGQRGYLRRMQQDGIPLEAIPESLGGRRGDGIPPQ